MEVPVSVHGIDPKRVDERAVKVVRTLQQAGIEAYVVGGAVRDLLVGLRPKDFDVATNATPEQVKGLFRRAFIIGRRFRIVHVIHGRGRDHEVIEVSTFRATMDSSEATQVPGNEKTSRAALAGSTHAVDASGRVLRDNVWGPQVEDAARRDFTVNAMYYDPETQTVIDYHHGMADVKAKRLRLIGDPATRYREDPVRIIRALRFAAKLGFAFEPRTAAPIAETAPLLANVPVSRMFDEMIKLLQTGHALASIDTLKAHHLHRSVFPVLDAVFDESRGTPQEQAQKQAFIRQALADTDRRVGEGKPVAPSVLLACLLWHDVLAGWRANQGAGEPLVPALQQAILHRMHHAPEGFEPFSPASLVAYARLTVAKPTTTQVQRALEALVRDGLVWRSSRGVYDVDDEMLPQHFGELDWEEMLNEIKPIIDDDPDPATPVLAAASQPSATVKKPPRRR